MSGSRGSAESGSHRDAPIVITGPTASGKGALARDLAGRLGGEIVSMDSMKVYREMDVATAKPGAAERAVCPHHLLDIRAPHEDFSVAEYLGLLGAVLTDLRRRARPAILCGGTALYLKAVLEGLQSGPGADWSLRERLLAEAASEGGSASLHARLARQDPVAAARIHPADLRRVVRALEVCAATGRPVSAGWSWGRTTAGDGGRRVFGIRWDRETLYARIDRRVDLMVERGLFEEAERLSQRSPPPGRSASQAIGYKEVREGLAAGRSRAEIAALIKQSSRRFAKRQLTWFRKLPIQWIAGTDDRERLLEDVLERL